MKLWITALLALMAATSAASAQDRFPKGWKVIEADNGARFAIEMNTVRRYDNGGASAVIYAIEGRTYNPHNEKLIFFDCRGHYMDTGFGGTVRYAPPRSVIGQLSKIACAVPHSGDGRPTEKTDRPANLDGFCDVLTASECHQLKATVRAGKMPVYCGPGYGLKASGLSSLQVRTCAAMHALK